MKVLVISANAFSRTQNNGKTFEAIFSHFEKGEMCQLYTRPQTRELIDFDYADAYYSVSELDIIKKLLHSKKECGEEIKSEGDYECPTVYGQKRSIYIHPFFRDLIWKIGLWKNRGLDDWIKREKPEHIFLVGGGERFLYEICWYIAKKFDIPYSLYYTDDYYIYPRPKSLLDWIQKKCMNPIFKKAIKGAKHAFVIGDRMKKEYESTFNRSFCSIMNSTQLYPYYSRTRSSKPYSVSYFGGLHLERWKMIVRLAALCGNIFDFYVFSTAVPNEKIEKAFKESNIHFMGALSADKVHDKMLNSDFLLHVESDDEVYKNSTRLSISTKIPEYLITGVPIIAFGPVDVASLQLLIDNELGLVLDSNRSNDELKQAIQNLIVNSDYNIISRKEYDYAINNFDRDTISTRFYNIICT